MKKKLLTAILSLTLIFAILLTGCVNQDMADKINKKAQSEAGYTYAQLLEDYKDPTIDLTIAKNGLVIYVNGCKNTDEVEEKYNAGKKLNAVYVTIALNKVIKAEFKQYTPDAE